MLAGTSFAVAANPVLPSVSTATVPLYVPTTTPTLPSLAASCDTASDEGSLRDVRRERGQRAAADVVDEHVAARGADRVDADDALAVGRERDAARSLLLPSS